jgi:DNA-binding Lrp family transcriptional regulator
MIHRLDDGASAAVDAMDRKILDILQRDASVTVAEIGRAIGLSSPLAGSASRSLRPKA